MSKLTTLASRSNEQRKARETLAQKHAKSTELSVGDKTLQQVTETIHHNSKTKGQYTTTKTVERLRTTKIVTTLRARSKAAHSIEERVKRDKKR